MSPRVRRLARRVVWHLLRLTVRLWRVIWNRYLDGRAGLAGALRGVMSFEIEVGCGQRRLAPPWGASTATTVRRSVRARRRPLRQPRQIAALYSVYSRSRWPRGSE